MPADRRRKDRDWFVASEGDELFGSIKQGAFLATLMDIRDELKELNAVFRCKNFQRIPAKLDAIRRNTARKRQSKNPSIH